MSLSTTRRTLIQKRGFIASLIARTDSNAISDVLFKTSSVPNAKQTTSRLQNSKKREMPMKHSRMIKQNHQLRKLVIKWSSGTAKQQAAVNSVLEEIMNINPKGKIMAVNVNDNTVCEHNIREYLKGIDLTEHGITIVRIIEGENSKEKIPMIKKVQTRIALKNYSDKLSKIREQELLNKGVGVTRIGRRNAENKSDATWKNIKISWQINDYDLDKQKRNEVTSHLKKGSKVAMFLNEKDSSNVSPVTAEELSDSNFNSLSKKERERREQLLVKLREIISDYSTQISEEGSISKRMIIKVLPNLVSVGQDIDKRTLKDQRRKERQEKLNKRLEKKKMKSTIEVN